MSRAFVSGSRYLLVSLAITACFIALLARLFHLHVLEQDKLARIVEQNRQQFQVLNARRGDIVDARGNLLATTNSVIELGVDPQALRPQDYEKIGELATLIGVTPEVVFSAFETRYRTVQGVQGRELRDVRWVRLAEAIDENRYEEIRALGIRGVYGNRKFERTYPFGRLAAHVLGFVNKEGTPTFGVERHLDFYLRGQDGWRESERDGRRRELSQFRHREVEPVAGLDVQLSIDSSIQHFVEQEISRLSEEFSPKGVTIIVSEVSTGYILGLGNYPNFDPNEFWAFPVDNHRNRAISDVFEPGSTFKIVPASAALNEGTTTVTTKYDCSLAEVEYQGRRMRLPRDSSRIGEVTMDEMVVKSSNRGAALLGMELGAHRLHDYAAAFGFGERTGYGADSEVRGRLHPVRQWDGLTITRLPMGHAVSATPLQIHYAMSVIANDGVLLEPRIIRHILDAEGNPALTFSPKAKHRVISSETAATMAAILARVPTSEGTARRAEIPGYAVAGKTGTTQKIINGRYSSSHHVASFVGFFPANRPRLVITVIVDEPQIPGTGYGGLVAAPAFRNVAEKCIQYLGIPAVREEEESLIAYSGPAVTGDRKP